MSVDLYEVRARKDKRGVDLISDVLPFRQLRCDAPIAVANALGYAKFYSRSHRSFIRVYDAADRLINLFALAGRLSLWLVL